METQLFRVVQIYARLTVDAPESMYMPAVKEICIIKETPKSYLVASDIASGWHSRILKDGHQNAIYSFTPTEAWDKYIATASAMLTRLRKQQGEICDLLAYARAQRKRS